MTLSRSSCFGYCADYRLQVHGNGRVEYDGNCSVAITGHHESHIPRHSVDSLLELFRQADFFPLEDRYIVLSSDIPSTEVSVPFDGKQKKVIDNEGVETGMPDAMVRLEEALDNAANSRRWTKGRSKTYLQVAKKHPCN